MLVDDAVIVAAVVAETMQSLERPIGKTHVPASRVPGDDPVRAAHPRTGWEANAVAGVASSSNQSRSAVPRPSELRL